jgi:CHAT domain-containing protein
MFLHLRMRPCLGFLLSWALLAGMGWPGATAGGPGEKPKPLTAAQQARLKEGDRLAAEAHKLEQAGQLAEAVAAWQKKLAIDRAVYGDVHEQVAQSQAELARLHESREDFPAARQARREVLALRLQLHGDKDWRVTDARLDLEDGDRLSKLTPESRRRLRQSLDLNRQVFSLWQRGRSREALPLARQALAIRRELLGEEHRDSILSTFNLAAQYHGLQRFADAKPLYERARDLYKRRLGEGHPDYATSLNNLALLYRDMGDYRQALPLFERARDLAKHLRGEDHPDYAESLNNLAGLYKDMGDHRQALPLLEQARDLTKRRLGEDHPLYARSLNNLAALYQDMGEYRQALPLYEQARDLYKRRLGEGHPDYATSLNNLALLYRDMGDYRQALPLFEQARDLYKRRLGEGHPDYATSLNNLAVLYQAMGDYRQALPLFEQARDLYKRRLGEGHPRYAISLNNLATLYQAMGDYRQALPLYEQARDLRQRRLGEGHPDYARSLNNLAVLYQAMGDYRQALPLHEQARDLYKRRLGEDHPLYALSLGNLARFHVARNQYAQAARPSTEALSRQRAFLDRTFAALSGRQRLDFLLQHQGYLQVYLSIACETGIAATESYPHVLAWKGAVAARHAEERLALDQPQLQPLLAELRQCRAGLARLARATPANKEQQADWRRRFDDLERRKEELETQLAQKSDSFRQYLGLRQATARQVADALPPQTALVDFLEYTHYGPPPEGKGGFAKEGRLLAFVLARGREPVCLQLGQAQPIAQAVRAWRRPMQSSPPGRLDDKAAAGLLGRVWQPLQKHLAGASTVLLAPDGALAALPFAALPGAKPGSYLLEEVALGYVTSGRQLLELAIDPGRRADGLLAVGGLPYGAAPDAATLALLPGKAALAELPGTRLEVERLERAFRKARPGERVTVLTGAAVDAARLQRELPAGRGRPGYRYLHLATHGFFEPPPDNVVVRRPALDPLGAEYRTFVRNPMLLSGLVLAGAHRDPAQAVLTAEEVSGLDLRGAELVVLSACDTGLGKVTGTEGVLGLQRGFHEAGARTLAASLWDVSDAATSVLMEEFYHHLWEAKAPGKLEALRRAQLAVLRDPARVEKRRQELRDALAKRGVAEALLETRGLGQKAGKPEVDAEGGASRSHPAWWAAFVLSGDTR